MIRILAIGDVMGKAGRQALAIALPRVRAAWNPDFIVCNGENAAGGFGLTRKIFDQFVGADFEQNSNHLGVHCVTMGNHWHDKREILDWADTEERLVLPANMMNTRDDVHGIRILRSRSGVEIAVINLIGKAFMHSDNRSPFQALERVANRIPERVRVRIVDMHAEATSEKQALGRLLDGSASLVYGTHSHVPTCDDRILPGGTGFVTDLGMTGPYDSVIGIRKDAAIRRMSTGEKHRFEPATDDLWFCALVADVDPITGRCVRLERIQWRNLENGIADQPLVDASAMPATREFIAPKKNLLAVEASSSIQN